jgi:hypothetical protein
VAHRAPDATKRRPTSLETCGRAMPPRAAWLTGSVEANVMNPFMVECYWPGTIEHKAPESLNRVVRVVGEAMPGEAARFLGCILVPADGLALFLFRASSEDIVRRIGRLSELPFDRIVQSIYIGFE